MRLLAHERGDDSMAAVRVYDKLLAHLAPLVGDAGVQLLFMRSAKLAHGDVAWLAEVSLFEGSEKLRGALRSADVANESAVVLFATFFALITTFIGDRLTKQVLRSAWPTIIDAQPRDKDT